MFAKDFMRHFPNVGRLDRNTSVLDEPENRDQSTENRKNQGISFSSKAQAVRSPGVVAAPAEAGEAAAEFLRDGRREPGVHIFEAAVPSVAARGFVQREEPLPALARSAGARIEEQICFGGEAQERGAEDAVVPFVGVA